MLQGQRDLEAGDPADHERGHAGRQRPARRVLPRRARRRARRGRAARSSPPTATSRKKGRPDRFALGEGLVGQAAVEGKPIRLDRRPGRLHQDLLGPRRRHAGAPRGHAGHVRGAGPRRHRARRRCGRFSEVNQAFLDQLTDTIGVVLNTIQANMRTEELLTQSQALTQELQKQSVELRQTNDELQDKALVLCSSRTATSRSRTPRSSSPARASRRRRPSSR